VQLLITVVQLSAPDAPFLAHLCQKENLQQLLAAAFDPPAPTTGSGSDVALASISVLESLISRLCETTNPFDGMHMNAGQTGVPEGHERSSAQQAAIEAVSQELVTHIPKVRKTS
jgi:hypothetical protein